MCLINIISSLVVLKQNGGSLLPAFFLHCMAVLTQLCADTDLGRYPTPPLALYDGVWDLSTCSGFTLYDTWDHDFYVTSKLRCANDMPNSICTV